MKKICNIDYSSSLTAIFKTQIRRIRTRIRRMPRTWWTQRIQWAQRIWRIGRIQWIYRIWWIHILIRI